MYDSKRALVSLLIVAGLVKLFQFGTILYNIFTAYNGHYLVAAIIFAIYVAVHFFGLHVAIKEKPCGLKAFSVQQIVFFVLHIVGFILLIWGNIVIHHSPTDNTLGNEPINLNKYQEGQDVLDSSTQPKVEVSTGCKLKQYMPQIALGLYIFTTVIDLVSAILSWKAYKQIIKNRAVETLTDLSQTTDTEMMMHSSTAHNVVPLNVVYVPANLYDPLQTYQ